MKSSNREPLEKKVDDLLIKIKLKNKDNIFIQKICNRGIPRVQANKLLSKELAVQLLSDIYLFNLIKIINETLLTSDVSLIPLEKYYTDIEMENFSNWEYEDKKIKEIVFENVVEFPKTIDQFVAFIDIEHMMQLFDQGLINYNFDTQREAKIVVRDNQIYKTININSQAVEEMTELMIKGEFIPNYITFNILKTGDEEIIYNSQDKTLAIKSGELDVLDGMHRTIALYQAKKRQPSLELFFGLNITNFDAIKARRFIVQEDKKNPISSEHIRQLNDDLSKVVLDVIKSESHDFKKRIAESSDMVSKNSFYLTTDVFLRENITKIFKMSNAREARKIGSMLAKNFDNLLGYIEEKYKTVQRIDFSYQMVLTYLLLFNLKENPTDDDIDIAIKCGKDLKKSLTLQKKHIETIEKTRKELKERL